MKKVLPVFLLLSFLALPFIVGAVDPGPVYPDPVTTICKILDAIKKIVLAIGFGIAVIMLVAGGIGYMTAGGDPEKSTKAKKLMINALIGVAIVLAATFIIALVQGLLSGGGVSLIGNPC